VGRHASTALGGPLYGQTGFVYEVAFAPHGKSLVSASLDKTIRRWSASLLQLQ
jgi:WD40 repeat protein